MIFNTHFNLVGRHADISASKYHWTNYDDEKFERVYANALAAQRGTDLHDLAKNAIRLGVKIKAPKTIAMYVNDAIGYRMTPEQILYYSDYAFGTADTISFRRNKLRIHDLKTGVNPCSFRQLEIYAIFFCLEYQYDPREIDIELRIYQSDEVKVYIPDPNELLEFMTKLIRFNKIAEEMRMEALS